MNSEHDFMFNYDHFSCRNEILVFLHKYLIIVWLNLNHGAIYRDSTLIFSVYCLLNSICIYSNHWLHIRSSFKGKGKVC